MTTVHTTNEKGHGCDPVPFQNHTTNDLDFTTVDRPSKALATIKAFRGLSELVKGIATPGDHEKVMLH